jgi:hypothetical protein
MGEQARQFIDGGMSSQCGPMLAAIMSFVTVPVCDSDSQARTP